METGHGSVDDLSRTESAAPDHARRLALVDHLDLVKRLEDAGAAAITMHSLFEEQITREQLGMVYHMELLDHGSSEALSYFPQAERLPPRARPVPGADPPHQADGEAAGHRLAQRHDGRRLARVRQADPAGRRRRARAERLLRRHRPARDRRRGRAPRRRHRPGRQGSVTLPWPSSCRRSTRRWPTWRPARRAGRRRPGALQPLLPARHRPRGTGGAAEPAPVDVAELLLRLRWLAVLFGRVKAHARRHGRRPHAARRAQGRHGRRRRRAGRLRPAEERARAHQGASSTACARGSRSTSTSRSSRPWAA